MKTNNFFRSLALATVAILGSTAAFAQGLSLQVNFANPSCFGLSNGKVVIDNSGGTEP